MALSGKEILDIEDVEIEPVEVPEWHTTVLVRGMSGLEHDAYEASIQQIRPKPDGSKEVVLNRDNARARLLVKCLVGEDGERLFKDNDAPALGKKNGKAIERLYDVAARLSGLSEEEKEAIEGNSEAAPSGDSPSSSPESSSSPTPESSSPASLPMT